MDNEDVKKFWNKNAENWTKLARLGYDVSRDRINTPAFFKILPDIKELKGMDIGCGEGHNTRIAAKKGAYMTGIDISDVFIHYAMETEKDNPLGITYLVESATHLPFKDNEFDFGIATMSLMDMADLEIVLREIHRVIKPKGFFQFSILHPCFNLLDSQWIRDKEGKKEGFLVRNYFTQQKEDIEEWIFGAAPDHIRKDMKKFKVPRFQRTLSEWLNLIIQSGFSFEEFHEPTASDELLAKYPEEYDAKIVPYFIIIRIRKELGKLNSNEKLKSNLPY